MTSGETMEIIKLAQDKSVVTKRDDPNFAQVSGYIAKDKALEFKIACTRRQISQSEALEEAVDKWLVSQNEASSTTPAPPQSQVVPPTKPEPTTTKEEVQTVSHRRTKRARRTQA